MSKRQRRLRNYLLAPREQLSFSVRMIVGVLALSQLQMLATPHMPGDEAHFLGSFPVFVISAIIVAIYTVVVTHRVFGPIRAMERYVDNLIADEAQGPLNLRAGDYFSGLAERLSRLQAKRASDDG